MTPRQGQVINAILRLEREHGRPPTHRELARAVGLHSLGALNETLVRLRRSGHISTDEPGFAQSLRVLKPAYDVIWRMENGELILGPLGIKRLEARIE